MKDNGAAMRRAPVAVHRVRRPPGRGARAAARCARQGRGEVGRGHLEEDDARRQGRAAGRLVRPLDVPARPTRTRSSRWRRRSASCGSAASTCSAAPSARRRVLLDNHYGTVILGQPLAAASLLNRLQARRRVAAAQHGRLRGRRGFRIPGATAFPRRWPWRPPATSCSRSKPRASPRSRRARIGVHVNFAPIADVNNNARNPVINTRVVRRVARRRRPARRRRTCAACAPAACSRRSSIFPGTATPTSTRTSACRSSSIRAIGSTASSCRRSAPGIAAGADAVMTAHIQLPALDAAEFSPATLSPPIVTGLLRGEMKFDGLVYTDSMGMDAIARRLLARRRRRARHQRRQRHRAAFARRCRRRWRASRRRSSSGEIPIAQIDASVRRILRAKARLGLHKTKLVSLDDVPSASAGARTPPSRSGSAQKSITLIKDDRNQVPLRVPREAAMLYLSVLDYPSGWRIARAEPDVPAGAAPALAVRHGHRAVGSIRRRRRSISCAPPPRATTRSSRRSSCARRRPAAAWICRRRS